jgi:hypothetical protein
LGQEHQVKVAVRPCAGRTIQSIRSAPSSISRALASVWSERGDIADFFERCYSWLNPGGWMSLQSIGLGAADRGVEGQFVAENIFPESDLPRLGEIADASEGIFEIVSVRNDRADYKRTNHEFRDRLRKTGLRQSAW